MRKLGVFLIALLLMLPLFSMIPFVKASIDVVDGYIDDVEDTVFLQVSHPTSGMSTSATYQSFTSNATTKLTNATFMLIRDGDPTGALYAGLYTHSGTYGTDSTPTGSALAISEGIDPGTISNVSAEEITFNFNASNRYEMVLDAKYCIALQTSGDFVGDVSNRIAVYLNATGTHDGNYGSFTLSYWVEGEGDLYFIVYGAGPEEIDVEFIEGLSFNEASSISYETPYSPITVQIVQPTNRTYDTATFPVELTYSTNGTGVTVGYNIWNITAEAFIYGDPQVYTDPTNETLSNGKYILHAEAENAEGYNATATRSFTVHVPTTEEHTLLFFGIGVVIIAVALAFAIGAKKGLGVKK